MKRKRHIVTSTAALVALAMAGCVDIESVGSSNSASSTRQQAITVVPEFVITGADAMPEKLFVSELGLTVSEIRLEPMWSKDSLAFSTRDPIVVGFDIADGQTVRTDEALVLPAEGRYLVSIRLEPKDLGDGEPASFSLDGFVAGERDSQQLVDTMDGRPQPMPFDGKQASDDDISDQEAYPQQWTPFEYRSRRAVFYTFNDVMLERGEQFLTFSFDVRDWAVDVVEPISNAVRSSVDTDDSVDVTNQIDSSGKGAEALIRTGVVRSDRRPR